MSKSHLISPVRSLVALALMMLALTACGCFPCEGYSTYTQMAPLAPPYPLIEEKQVPENPQVSLWRPGYWEYVGGGDFSWVSGELIARPSPTADWSPEHWARRSYGWALIPGYWQ